MVRRCLTWTAEQRQAHGRDGLRYPGDLTDAEWALVEPLIPPAKRGGRKRTVDVREVLNAIFYILATGCQWRALPKDLSPKSTVYDYLTLWTWDGTLKRLHRTLYVQVREQAGKEASLTAAIIDSQSVKSAEKGGRGSTRRVMTQARRSRARSGHILVDTLGLLLGAGIHPANIQDRDGAMPVLRVTRRLFPFIKVIPRVKPEDMLCRWRLPGQGRQESRGCHRLLAAGDRQARLQRRLAASAQALDRQAHLRLARPLPQARRGLREPRRQRARLPLPGHDPAHAASLGKSLNHLEILPDGL